MVYRTKQNGEERIMNKSDIVFCNGEISIQRTGKDYDFIATVENETDGKIELFIGDPMTETTESFVIEPKDWMGICNDSIGRWILNSIASGKFTYERI